MAKGKTEMALMVSQISLRTGLSHKCVRELLEKDWMFVEKLTQTHRWEKVPWLERKARNAKR